MQCCTQSAMHSTCGGTSVPLAVALYVLPNLCTHGANLRNLPMTLGCAVKMKMSDLLCIRLTEYISCRILLD